MTEHRNLYEQIFDLRVHEEYSKADAILRTILQADPENHEAFLCTCELRLAQNRDSEVASAVSKALDLDPENPYYLLAQLHLGLHLHTHSPDQLRAHLERTFNAALHSYDALAKLGLLCARTGFWSLSLQVFVKSMRLMPGEDEKFLLPDDAGITETIAETKLLDNHLIQDFDGIPFPIIVRAYFLLLSVNDAGVPEAWLAICKLLSLNQQLADAQDQNQLPELFDNHCQERWFESSITPLMAQLGSQN